MQIHLDCRQVTWGIVVYKISHDVHRMNHIALMQVIIKHIHKHTHTHTIHMSIAIVMTFICLPIPPNLLAALAQASSSLRRAIWLLETSPSAR